MPDASQKTYTIRELSQEFDVTPRSLRFYEDQGLLSPRREGQKRIYSRRDRARLKLILRGKRLGMSLSEIYQILSLYDSPEGGEIRQLEVYLAQLEEKRQMLLQRRKDIEEALAELESSAQRCRELLESKRREAARSG
jgi:Predicted transcriptional regulators